MLADAVRVSGEKGKQQAAGKPPAWNSRPRTTKINTALSMFAQQL